MTACNFRHYALRRASQVVIRAKFSTKRGGELMSGRETLKTQFGVGIQETLASWKGKADQALCCWGPPHIPGRCADDFFFALNHKPKPFVEIDVLQSVGF